MQIDLFMDKLFSRAKQAGFEDCEAYYVSDDSFTATVFNGSVIGYNVSSSLGLNFRGLLGGKMGYASTQVFDEEAVDLLVEGASTNAKLIENEDEQFLFAGSESYPELNGQNPALDALSAAEKIDMALSLEKKTLALDPRITQVDECGVMSSSGTRRIVNTKGLNVSFSDNSIGIYVIPIAKQDDKAKTSLRYDFQRDAGKINLDELAGESVREAIEALSAESMDSGKYKIVLRHDAAASLLSTFASTFGADEAQKGLSLLKGREGERVASECISLLDDPILDQGMAMTPFDAEGMATKRKRIIDRGVLTTLLHNLKTANKQKVSSTANASKGSYASPVSVAPSNFYIEPSDQSFDELIRRVGDGLLITQLQGMHSGANAISGDFSLGASGYRIVDGKIGAAVDQITLAGNFFQLLMGIEAVASDLRFGLPGASCYGSPSLFVGELSVAGK